jgi:STE24 endopeptidase
MTESSSLTASPPSTAPSTLDPHLQAKAREYARLRRRLLVADLALSGLLSVAWLALGWSGALKVWLTTFTRNEWVLVAAYGVIFGLIATLIDLPLEYYSGFHLPHRYGQSNETLAGWVKDQALGLLLSGVIGLPMLEGVYWALRTTGDAWWLWTAGGMIAFSVVFATLAPVIIMPLFNKYTPLGAEYADLAARLTALAQQAGTTVSGVFRFDLSRRTKAANAALTGLGRSRRIILGDTLLQEFTNDEIETVIAHELAHHVHRDIPLGLAVSSLSSLAGLYLISLTLKWGVAVLGFSGPADIAALPLLILALGAFGLVTMPINNAFSRWREKRADLYALQVTHKPTAFANAMTRLANQNLAEADPERWVVWLLHSHPPIRDRIALAQSFQPDVPRQA